MLYCPFMSYQKQYNGATYCFEEDCAIWDNKNKKCVLVSMTDSISKLSLNIESQNSSDEKSESLKRLMAESKIY